MLDLSELGAHYESTLDENRKLFLSMKQLVKEKDAHISKLVKELHMKNALL